MVTNQCCHLLPICEVREPSDSEDIIDKGPGDILTKPLFQITMSLNSPIIPF